MVMHDDNLDWRIQQLPVAPGSDLAGRTVEDMRIAERTGALLLAVRRSPGAAARAQSRRATSVAPAGTVLIALGTPGELASLTASGRDATGRNKD